MIGDGLTPDYFLTYGEYWNKQIKIPGKTYVVGNPHFHESIKRYKDIKEEKNTILIVSQWTLTKEFVEIAKSLASEFKDKKIIFKMHPEEMKNYYLIKPLEAFRNIEIQKDGDIYELLAKYENIVACYSTTVFEALAFNKRIYILDNSYSKNYIPKEIGIKFKNFSELNDLIKNKVKNENEPDIEYYFNSNWKENYKKFIEQEIGITLNNKNRKIFSKTS
jgi:CDP-glycerol glycerophosphotransferase (TagB/SpsB family)